MDDRPFAPPARFPFYNLTNVRDLSASVSVRPASRLTLHADVRAIGLGYSLP